MGVDQAAGVARAILGVAGDGVVGIYRYGSAVDGGLRPASDIDVLAVVRESLTPGQRATLVARLRADREGDPACRPVEMTIVVRSQVVPWHYPPIADLAYGEWFPADHAWDPAPCPHLAVELTQVLAAYAVPLAGPPPGNLLDPVPRADLVRSGRDAVPGLRADLTGDARNVLLTLARIWYTAETGRLLPKDTAAAWAVRRLRGAPARVLTHTRTLCLTSTYADETWPTELRERVGATADELAARIGAG